jgi:hypothetical protein
LTYRGAAPEEAGGEQTIRLESEKKPAIMDLRSKKVKVSGSKPKQFRFIANC